MTAGQQTDGASSPEKPALHILEPLSITMGVPTSILIGNQDKK